jgi:hypothetical protein
MPETSSTGCSTSPPSTPSRGRYEPRRRRQGARKASRLHRGANCLHDALDALGGLESMLGSCAWSVLGEERSIRHWAGIYGRATIGRRAAEMAVVLGALGALKVHFGF